MFDGAGNFNQCLTTWAGKTPDEVNTNFMFFYSPCTGQQTPYPNVGPWCQTEDQCSSNVPSNCIDDPDVRLKGKTCKKYLAKKRNRKCKQTIKDVLVADSCPSLCKNFCRPCKNKSGKIKLVNSKKTFNCKKIKKKKLCDSRTKAGQSAEEVCPVSCSFGDC